ncbi:ABC-2 type transport system permease protein [Streptosporangium becharense]|uniref:Transport permease protein n=1 Tax=Streptosporangium becharense TaxID=1816182 RepID=A0A7W9IE66_9ACTN|nr:ABC transporter permease [Streptosporangium becharense]MBB2909951.1 ABC-2 type transport system permease protein [Streptosporangium becharense]MBB5819094.1 ABC-2 type transport system permease protein [Streptosporangium becharense]
MTQTQTAAAEIPTAPRAAAQPSVVRLGLSRAAIEIRMFFREKDAVIFTFAFPIILLVIFGSIFADELEGTGISVSQLYVAGLIGSATMTGFQSLGINIAGERDDGTLKRLRGTPLPPASYFVGKALVTLLVSFLQVVILLAIGVAMFELELPSEASRWATFAWVFTLGVLGSALLGIAISSLPRTHKSATPVIAMPFVVLQFISGVFIPAASLPSWLVNASAVFPLKWMCQGFRSVFLGDSGAALELTKSYELDRVALVLGAWVVGGLVLCLMTFRWKSRRDG